MPAPTAAATQLLIRRFRSRRPLRAGSLLLTIFGDAIAPRGGAATLGSLIRLAAPFGLRERLVRTSVARLAQEDWLVARRDGRLSEYRLTPGGERRFAEATRRIYGANPLSWDGQWILLVLPPAGGGRPRDGLREELRWLGFGQVSPGVFAHPAADLQRTRQELRNLNLPSRSVLLRSSSGSLAEDRQLVACGWDLGELTRRYRQFVAAFEPFRGMRTAAIDTEAAFVIRTLLIHDYRKIHLQDPLLPPALLPDGWVGTAAYELCCSLYASVFAAAESFLSETASTVKKPLPAAHPVTYTRFGGISAPPDSR